MLFFNDFGFLQKKVIFNGTPSLELVVPLLFSKKARDWS
jgi:hypothetical protein